MCIRDSDKAESVMKDHCMKSFDCMERMGLNVKGYFDNKIRWSPNTGSFLSLIHISTRQ